MKSKIPVDEESSGSSESESTIDEDLFKSSASLAASLSQEYLPERLARTGPAQPALAEEETKYIGWSKILVVLVLALATLGTALGAFVYTRRSEEVDFRTRYSNVANEIVLVSLLNALHIFETFENLSLQMTAFARGTRSEWPFVQYPHFEAQAAKALDQTGARYISYTPLVSNSERQDYEIFSFENQDWIEESIAYSPETSLRNASVPSYIHDIDPSFGEHNIAETAELYAPIAHTSPLKAGTVQFLNYNAFNYNIFEQVFAEMANTGRAVLSEVLDFGLLSEDGTTKSDGDEWPASFMATPIYDKILRNGGGELVGVIVAEVPWDRYFQNVIPEGIEGIDLVVRNTCGQEYTYAIHGRNTTYVGPGDFHDPKYDADEVSTKFTAVNSIEDCQYSIHLYPSDELVDSYQTDQPLVNSVAVVVIFIATTVVFMIYDWLVERRQEKIMSSATRTNAIVESLFPENVRNRLLLEVGHGGTTNNQLDTGTTMDGMKGHDHDERPQMTRLFSSTIWKDGTHPFLTNTAGTRRRVSVSAAENENPTPYVSKPIADLFPHATVLFGDIAGFTAWSSVREPCQVFTLLETVYGAFDKAASKLGVFKVETIGDSYVAATGLPEPRTDHAVVMARFARTCLLKLKDVVYKLDSRLGPGTAELTMRFGIHSGPVTAGVLRGEKSRFQLFGDTVNTAARMESTGVKGKIQLSQDASDSLIACGKGRWVTPRKVKVVAKGKGELQTYWLVFRSHMMSDFSQSSISMTESTPTTAFHESSDDEGLSYQPDPTSSTSYLERLVDWNVDNLECLIKKIVSMRQRRSQKEKRAVMKSIVNLDISTRPDQTVLDEVKEFITIPNTAAAYQQDPDTVSLGPEVRGQLRDYVKTIACMHDDHPFHSFSHATHVGQSVCKLLSRVVTPDSNNLKRVPEQHQNLHRFTYGIASDPITQFACSFSAMIHDVDHPGVPNTQLVEEQTDTAIQYKNKSVAEQNSVDVAWELLMEPRYLDLRACIYTNQSELDRFRQLVVNAVMATDVVDSELGAKRRSRWEKAFEWNDEGALTPELEKEVSNRKATVVIEHLMLASDVAHTMQHWHVFAKWNEKLFHEMYKAYRCGRAASDPSLDWYKGELSFFDCYIIPLAKKLKECGVFGVASDEYLNYAEANRREWELKGQEIVKEYLVKFKHMEEDSSYSSRNGG